MTSMPSYKSERWMKQMGWEECVLWLTLFLEGDGLTNQPSRIQI